SGPDLRALLIRLVEASGILARDGSGLEQLDKARRTQLARLGVKVGALDLFVPALVKPAPLAIWAELARLAGGRADLPADEMPPVLPAGKVRVAGYRRFGGHLLRIDMAEKLLREAHGARVAAAGKPLVIDSARAVSMGLSVQAHAHLLRVAGFLPREPRALPEGAFGPPRPVIWRWRPPRRQVEPESPARESTGNGAFDALAGLFA
ncbi:MAG TPA: helicase, partial [Novosphingobium sp.]|nr:helicase [Novosphingobium sp.]